MRLKADAELASCRHHVIKSKSSRVQWRTAASKDVSSTRIVACVIHVLHLAVGINTVRWLIVLMVGFVPPWGTHQAVKIKFTLVVYPTIGPLINGVYC